jgi:uncharacterized membrane protein required for colicin V production
MTGIDWIIVCITILFAIYGYTRGLLTGVLSFGGFVLGVFLGTRLLGAVLPDGANSPYAPLLGLSGALLAGFVLFGSLAGVGRYVHRLLRFRSLQLVDSLLGAALTASVGLAIFWVLGAVALHTPGADELRRSVQRSAILMTINAFIPPSGPLLNALARIDPLPQIRGPAAQVKAPDRAVARDPQVRRAAKSVYKVLGNACGLGLQGSGWAAGSQRVVTNAHVVAGADRIVVQRRSGVKFAARAIWFDPDNDVAILRADRLGTRSLRLLTDPKAGIPGAILGYPNNGPLTIRAGRLGPTETVTTDEPIGPLQREVTSLRGKVQSGNSGGPMVDRRGRVLTTIFASATNTPKNVGYGLSNRIVKDALDRAGGSVDTGPCVRR